MQLWRKLLPVCRIVIEDQITMRPSQRQLFAGTRLYAWWISGGMGWVREIRGSQQSSTVRGAINRQAFIGSQCARLFQVNPQTEQKARKNRIWDHTLAKKLTRVVKSNNCNESGKSRRTVGVAVASPPQGQRGPNSTLALCNTSNSCWNTARVSSVILKSANIPRPMAPWCTLVVGERIWRPLALLYIEIRFTLQSLSVIFI